MAQNYVDHFEDRTVWMVNSTAQGGGVAEMLPKVVSILREIGVSTEWAVIVSEEDRFFQVTKHIHNLLHGTGDPHLSDEDRTLSVSELTDILRRARLTTSPHPTVDGDCAPPARRLQRDGSFAPATRPEDLGLMDRPIVTQISRWDRLKGFAPLLQGFARLKEPNFLDRNAVSERDRTRLALSRPFKRAEVGLPSGATHIFN